jgi:hypothetical protein
MPFTGYAVPARRLGTGRAPQGRRLGVSPLTKRGKYLSPFPPFSFAGGLLAGVRCGKAVALKLSSMREQHLTGFWDNRPGGRVVAASPHGLIWPVSPLPPPA